MRRLQPADLSLRDKAILRDLARVRLLTGSQLERLHFDGLVTPNARGSARRRSLGRLVRLGLVTALPRRVGGERAGSAGLVYTLDARAHRERVLWNTEDGERPSAAKSRRPWAIGWLFVSHTLDIAELYVRLREAERDNTLRVLRFDAEPASWFKTGGEPLKPDAYVVLEVGGWERHWWIEVDRATESLPTLRRKFGRYLDLYKHGSAGPDGVLPRVLVTVPDKHRRDQVDALVRQMGDDVRQELVEVHTFEDAMAVLPGEEARPPP
jgi:hypothetical protein